MLLIICLVWTYSGLQPSSHWVHFHLRSVLVLCSGTQAGYKNVAVSGTSTIVTYQEYYPTSQLKRCADYSLSCIVDIHHDRPQYIPLSPAQPPRHHWWDSPSSLQACDGNHAAVLHFQIVGKSREGIGLSTAATYSHSSPLQYWRWTLWGIAGK